MTMDSQTSSQNRYNQNSGSLRDQIINEMLGQKKSNEEIAAALAALDAPEATTGATDASGANIDFLDQQRADDKDQQDMENLLQLIDLLGSEDQSPPETPRLDLPQGNNMEMPDGSSELALSSATARNNMALMNDDIMRQRNRKDATWMLQNQPAAAQRAPVDIMQRVAEAKSLYDMLRGKAAPEAAPAALATQAPPLGQPVVKPSPEQVMNGTPIADPAMPQIYDPTDLQSIIRNRLLGAR